LKVGELKGYKNIGRIECSCGEVWTQQGNNGDKRKKQSFIKKHAEHEIRAVLFLFRG